MPMPAEKSIDPPPQHVLRVGIRFLDNQRYDAEAPASKDTRLEFVRAMDPLTECLLVVVGQRFLPAWNKKWLRRCEETCSSR